MMRAGVSRCPHLIVVAKDLTFKQNTPHRHKAPCGVYFAKVNVEMPGKIFLRLRTGIKRRAGCIFAKVNVEMPCKIFLRRFALS